MEKREVIILGIMAVVVLYGAFAVLWGKSDKKSVLTTAMSSTELQTMTGDLAVTMSKDILSPAEAYAIVRAEGVWLRDPFFERKSYRELVQSKASAKAVADTGKKITFNYTGYIEYGGRKMAIINGLEYAAGDVLETKGYLLRTVTPAKVTIENVDSKTKIEVSLDD